MSVPKKPAGAIEMLKRVQHDCEVRAERSVAGGDMRAEWQAKAIAIAESIRLLSAIAEVHESCHEFRDAILNERQQMAEMDFDSDMINAVLGVYDDTIGAALEKL